MKKERVVIIVGPTAVGKTALSIELAKKFNGEIVSADSAQIYKGLDIGSAKVTKEEKEDIIHHMIDIIPPTATYSVGEWVNEAKQIITSILKRKKTPIIVGGTGLYVSSLLFEIGSTCGRDEAYRKELNELIETQGKETLYNMLKEIDPESAETLHPNQLDRIIRALEIYHITGKKKSENKNSTESNYDYLLIGLTDDREILYQRINSRVDKMINDGLLSEGQTLLESGVTKENQSMQAIGYKETISYLLGETDKQTFIDKLKQNSRNYAKRQITWFKKMPNLIWYKYNDKNQIIKNVGEFING